MSLPSLDYRNINTLWASVLVETLGRMGVKQAVISPGSRSTPLAVAFARHSQFETIPVLDERSASFFALGLARRSRTPVVLVCTSGTAGANYYPAVIEAQESGVPLIIITADRPPELRACASGQTIDQQMLFGSHVNFYHEFAVPEASWSQLAYLRQTVAHAMSRAVRPQSGPVHLNAPFRDPLAPVPTEETAALETEMPPDFFTHLHRPAAVPVGVVDVWPQGWAETGVIVAGPEMVENPADYAARVGALAAELGWPVLADGVSPLRHFPTGDAVVVSTYDAILRNPKVAVELQPKQILCLGGWPTSKVLRQWVQQSRAEVILLSPRHDNRDGVHARTRQVCAPVEALRVERSATSDGQYVESWKCAEQTVASILREPESGSVSWFEGDVVGVLDASLPAGTSLYVASSMPIRDVEYFWPVNQSRRTFHFNRGTNGIDGTLSTALGVAHGSDPTVLLTGDLALLHDGNGMLLRRKFRGSLTIVLINNTGGGIFEHLPMAEFDPPFEEYFATPQQVDFPALCQAHGINHTLVEDRGHLSALCAELPAKGIRVLEVVTDRKRDAALRKQRFASTAATLG